MLCRPIVLIKAPNSLALCLHMEVSFSEEAVENCGTSYLQEVISLEILLHILHFLRTNDKFRLRRTCRRFYRALSDPAVWRLIEFDYYHTPNRKALDGVFTFCSGVKKLEVNTRGLIPRFPWVRFTKRICRCAPTLTHLTLLGFHLSSEQFNTSLASFSSLSHIMLEFELSTSIWFPAMKSLKLFEIRVSTIREFLTSAALKAWLQNGFFPRRFQISSEAEKCARLHVLLPEIDRFVHGHLPVSIPPDIQAQFYLMYCDGPVGVFQHRPFLQLKIEGSHCSVPVAHCSEITSAPLLLVLSSPQSAIRTAEQLPRVCLEIPFSSVASTLTHLSLIHDGGLNHDNLKEVASHCPLLKTLCLDICRNALVDVSGLASISEKCLKLEVLSLFGIHMEGINRALLWNVLSDFKRLLYLSLEFCLFPASCPLPEKKIDTLLSMQVGCGSSSECIGCSNISLETMTRIIPTSLRVLRMDFPAEATDTILGSGFNDLLCAVPKLQGLYIEKRMELTLPTDPMCYQSLSKLYVRCFSTNITCEVVEALIHSGELTHCYFIIGFISPDAMCKLIEAPKLVCCRVSCKEKKSPPESKIHKAAKVHGIPDFFYGIRKFYHAPIDADLRITWNNY